MRFNDEEWARLRAAVRAAVKRGNYRIKGDSYYGNEADDEKRRAEAARRTSSEAYGRAQRGRPKATAAMLWVMLHGGGEYNDSELHSLMLGNPFPSEEDLHLYDDGEHSNFSGTSATQARIRLEKMGYIDYADNDAESLRYRSSSMRFKLSGVSRTAPIETLISMADNIPVGFFEHPKLRDWEIRKHAKTVFRITGDPEIVAMSTASWVRSRETLAGQKFVRAKGGDSGYIYAVYYQNLNQLKIGTSPNIAQSDKNIDGTNVFLVFFKRVSNMRFEEKRYYSLLRLYETCFGFFRSTPEVEDFLVAENGDKELESVPMPPAIVKEHK